SSFLHHLLNDENLYTPDDDRSREPWRDLLDACDFLGQLTAIDGATVITTDLRVMAFGAFARTLSGHSDAKTIEMPSYEDETEHEIKIKDTGGSRHQSAARFCSPIPGSAAVVASQDGFCTFMTRPGDSSILKVWKDCEYLFQL